MTCTYKTLLQKLGYYGIYNNEIKWFTDYLSCRTQSVFCNGKLSEPAEIGIGVPQGSILGPILFLLYINDISQHINGNCNLYADDIAIYTSGITIYDTNNLLQKCVDQAMAWYKNNNLVINTNKSNVMLIGSQQKMTREAREALSITAQDIQLSRVSTARYLGVTVDDTLSWNQHTHSLCLSLSHKIRVLGRVSKFGTKDLLDTMYRTSIQPVMDYACTVWANSSVTNNNLIHRIQKRAARIVLNNFDFINVRGQDLVESLKWQTLTERKQYFLATLMYKAIHGDAPQYMCNQLTMACEYHNRDTRYSSSMNVHVPKPKHESLRNSFQYSGAVAWNQLPMFLKESSTLEGFKKGYKKHYFYQKYNFSNT